jgi:nucleoside-triphosphatase
MRRVLLLTGQPGTGKTALIKEALARTKVKGGGFYSEEIRTGGIRQGFRIVTLDGQEATFAHVDISSPYRVSKYKVDIDALNRVGVSALCQALKESDLIVIDEIGKMELLSQAFRDAVWAAVHSDRPVLGTITLRPHSWADSVKALPQVTITEVTEANRDKIAPQILDLFKQ